MVYFLEIKQSGSRTGLYMYRSKFRRMIDYTYFLRMGFVKSQIRLWQQKYFEGEVEGKE